MNASIAYTLTILAAICIPVALVLVPTAQAAGVAAVVLMSVGEVWRRAMGRERRATLRQILRAASREQSEQSDDAAQATGG